MDEFGIVEAVVASNSTQARNTLSLSTPAENHLRNEAVPKLKQGTTINLRGSYWQVGHAGAITQFLLSQGVPEVTVSKVKGQELIRVYPRTITRGRTKA